MFTFFDIIGRRIIFPFQNASRNVCKLLVGNKIDCEEDYKVISTEKGKEVYSQWYIMSKIRK